MKSYMPTIVLTMHHIKPYNIFNIFLYDKNKSFTSRFCLFIGIGIIRSRMNYLNPHSYINCFKPSLVNTNRWSVVMVFESSNLYMICSLMNLIKVS